MSSVGDPGPPLRQSLLFEGPFHKGLDDRVPEITRDIPEIIRDIPRSIDVRGRIRATREKARECHHAEPERQRRALGDSHVDSPGEPSRMRRLPEEAAPVQGFRATPLSVKYALVRSVNVVTFQRT